MARGTGLEQFRPRSEPTASLLVSRNRESLDDHCHDAADFRNRPEGGAIRRAPTLMDREGLRARVSPVFALSRWTKRATVGAGLPRPARDTSFSSNREAIEGLGLAPAPSMRATAPDRLLTGTNRTIGKRLGAGRRRRRRTRVHAKAELRASRYTGCRVDDAPRPEIGEYEGLCPTWARHLHRWNRANHGARRNLGGGQRRSFTESAAWATKRQPLDLGRARPDQCSRQRDPRRVR